MIKKLRIKFIVLSMIAVVILLAAIIFGMNFINYNSIVKDADEVLDVLSQNGGGFPRKDKTGSGGNNINMPGIKFPHDADDYEDIFEQYDDFDDFDDFDDRKMPHWASPETPYETRFFSVVLDDDDNELLSDMSKIKAISEEKAVEYSVEAIQSGKTKGFIDNYRFSVSDETEGKRVTFLDCGRKLEAFSRFKNASVMMAAIGCILFFIVIFLFSKRIVRPAAVAYEKQKRFISDAGHEIKTPLTIIKADADILEMDIGDNEWLSDINKQTERLSALTNDLIYLSKTEEGDSFMNMIEFPLSDVVGEMAESFNMLAKSQNKKYDVDITPMISYEGDEKAIGQLISVLLDNAFKYSPEGGRVSLTLSRSGKNILLTVFNDATDEISKENLSLIFDRFYRIDSSRNSKTGGYGIGLSMAKAIVSAHGGRINARSDDGRSLTVVCEL